MTASPSAASSNVASSVEVSGRVSITVHMAPIPMATAGTSSSPGRPDAAMPPVAPMNMAGNTGPPRKLDSDSAYARPLQSMSRRSAPTDRPPAPPTSDPSASWPENRTSEASWLVASANPMASPAISTPSTGISRTIRRSTCGRTASASSWIPRPTNGAISPNAMAHPNIAPVGRSNGGSPGTASE